MPANANQFVDKDINLIPGTIANGGAITGNYLCYGASPVGLQIPATMSASKLGFNASYDNGKTFAPLLTGDGSNTAYTVLIPTSGGAIVPLDITVMKGITALQITTPSSTESSARTILLKALSI